jgi:hypothetical protein
VLITKTDVFVVYLISLVIKLPCLFLSAFVDTGDGTKKIDPMIACRVVVIKWVAQYTHLTRYWKQKVYDLILIR